MASLAVEGRSSRLHMARHKVSWRPKPKTTRQPVFIATVTKKRTTLTMLSSFLHALMCLITSRTGCFDAPHCSSPFRESTICRKMRYLLWTCTCSGGCVGHSRNAGPNRQAGVSWRWMHRHPAITSLATAVLLLVSATICLSKCIQVPSPDTHACCHKHQHKSSTPDHSKPCSPSDVTSEAATPKPLDGPDHVNATVLVHLIAQHIVQPVAAHSHIFPKWVDPPEDPGHARISVLRI